MAEEDAAERYGRDNMDSALVAAMLPLPLVEGVGLGCMSG